jgi:hypothetical protein
MTCIHAIGGASSFLFSFFGIAILAREWVHLPCFSYGFCVYSLHNWVNLSGWGDGMHRLNTYNNNVSFLDNAESDYGLAEFQCDSIKLPACHMSQARLFPVLSSTRLWAWARLPSRSFQSPHSFLLLDAVTAGILAIEMMAPSNFSLHRSPNIPKICSNSRLRWSSSPLFHPFSFQAVSTQLRHFIFIADFGYGQNLTPKPPGT